jgi:serine/threonine-protein kinase
VERVILRCLEPDPAQRPASALSVAAALPGGDPLAAALAAGETPSPEMVAEAGHQGAVGLAISWGALAVFAAALATFVALTPRTSLLGMVALDKPPQFLEERARELLAVAGLSAKPADHIFSFEPDLAYLDHLKRTPVRDAGQGSGGILFWYRQSPEPLARRAAATIGEWMADPPNTTPGMAQVALDPRAVWWS